MKTAHFNMQDVRFEMERGKGGSKVFQFPIAPEPPFSKFSHGNNWRQSQDHSLLEYNVAEKACPKPIVTVRVKPSREDRWLEGLAEQFLLSLTGQVVFEIIAYQGRITCQMAMNPDKVDGLIACLNTLYPNCEAFKAEDLLGKIPTNPMAVTNYRLKESHLFHLKIDFKLDTYGSLFGALASISGDQFGIFQVVFSPVKSNWGENIRMAVRSQFDPTKSAFYDLPDLPKLADKKASKSIFAVSLRLAGSTLNVMDRMEGFLNQFGGDNGFVPLCTPYPSSSVFKRTVHTTGMLLNAEELTLLVHMPSPDVISNMVESADRGVSPPPIATRRILIPLGVNRNRGIETIVGISEEESTKHVVMVGKSGEGKTTLIIHMLVSLAEKNYGFAFVDPAGDAARQLVGIIPRYRQDDCVYFDPGDTDNPPAFNVLQSTNEREGQLLCSDLIASFENYYRSAWGPRMAMVLRNAINLLFDTTGEKTLLDLSRVLTYSKYREELLADIKDLRLLDFWRNVYPGLPKGASDPILNKLSEFVDNPIVRNVIAQPNLIDANRIMGENKIFIASLCKGLLGEDSANLLGSFLVSKFRMAAMARAGVSPQDRKLFTMVIDEAQNYAGTRANASIITSCLSEARKYRVPLVLATQFFHQLHPDAIAGILGNVGTLIVFRSGLPDAQILEKELGKFEVNDVFNLNVGEALVRMGRANSSFNVKVYPPRMSDAKLAEDVIKISQVKYCRLKEEVERMICQQKPVVAEEKAVKDDERLTTDQLSFLQYLRRNPNLPTTTTYRALGLSNYSGNKMKQLLIKNGLVCEVRTKLGRRDRIAKFLVPSQSACKKMGLPPYHGRGGLVHQYLQSFVRQHAEANGYQVQVEYSIPGTDESIDVVTEKDGIVMAFEIAVTSMAERELHNIKKCLNAGCNTVVVLFVDTSVLDDTKNLVQNSLEQGEINKISLGLIDEVAKFL